MMPKPQIFANMSFINYPQNGMPHFMSLDFLLNHGNLDPHSETTSVSELDISFWRQEYKAYMYEYNYYNF